MDIQEQIFDTQMGKMGGGGRGVEELAGQDSYVLLCTVVFLSLFAVSILYSILVTGKLREKWAMGSW